MATGYQNAGSDTPRPCRLIGPSTTMTYYYPPNGEQLAPPCRRRFCAQVGNQRRRVDLVAPNMPGVVGSSSFGGVAAVVGD